MKALLVIGYGNTLRRDDGAGPKTAEAVDSLQIPSVFVHVCHQLTPELADPISKSSAVIFIDAAVTASKVEFHEIEANDAGQIFAHSTDPRSLLGLARKLYGCGPRAWTVAIPAVDLDFGDGFSPRTEAGCLKALNGIQSLLRRLQSN